MTCPSCGAANPARARFCATCGSPLAAGLLREAEALAERKGNLVARERACEYLPEGSGEPQGDPPVGRTPEDRSVHA